MNTVGQFALSSSLCLRTSADFSLGTDSRRARCDELEKHLPQAFIGDEHLVTHTLAMLWKSQSSLPASEWKRA